MYQQSTLANQSQVLIAIDQFIHAVLETDISDQVFRSSLIELIPLFYVLEQEELSYCQSVETFKELIIELQRLDSELMPFSVHSLNAVQIDYLKCFIIDHHIEIEAELKAFSRQERRNRKSLSNYLHQLTQHYAKLLFVRVDLAIQLEHQMNVGILQFNAYLHQFLSRLHQCDTCFRDLQGFAWAIEQGQNKGYHCHLLLIYDGHKHQNDFGLALMVGQCWKDITAHQGCFFTSNSPEYKTRFEQQGTLGIGMIHRNNSEQVQNAINAAMYLVNPEKEYQYLRAKSDAMRTFGRGQYVLDRRRRRF